MEGKDPLEEVNKKKINMWILNRDVETKLLRVPQKTKGKHYENTRKKDAEA